MKPAAHHIGCAAGFFWTGIATALGPHLARIALLSLIVICQLGHVRVVKHRKGARDVRLLRTRHSADDSRDLIVQQRLDPKVLRPPSLCERERDRSAVPVARRLGNETTFDELIDGTARPSFIEAQPPCELRER
jgi:hypothetical protein